MITEFQFQEIKSTEDIRVLESIVEFFARNLGAGYITADILSADIVDPKSFVDLTYDSSNHLCAVCISRIFDESNRDEEYVQKFQSLGAIPDEGEFRVGLFGTIAVEENLRGKGIGSELYRRSENFVREKRCSVMITVVWESGRPDCSKPLFVKQGYEELKTIPEFWKNYSIEHNADCPNCGRPPCVCSATMMKKNLS